VSAEAESPAVADPVRVAMVGLGVWGRSQMERSVAKSPFVECVACCDADPAETSRFAEEFGLRALGSFEEILADDEIEAALLFTPNPVHPAHAMELAAAGKHAYLTKPVANHAKEAVDMISAAEDAGTVLFVDHGMSVTPRVKAIERSIGEGLVGDVLMAQANRSGGPGWKLGPDQWRFHREKCPGGAMIQIGVYMTATLAYLFGKPLRATATAMHGLTGATIENSLVMTVEYESGCRAAVLSSYFTKVNTHYMHLFGVEGNIFVGPQYLDRAVRYMRDDEWEVKELAVTETDAVPTAKEQFYRQVREARAPEHSLEMALNAVAAIDAGLRSAARGEAVEIAEVLERMPQEEAKP